MQRLLTLVCVFFMVLTAEAQKHWNDSFLHELNNQKTSGLPTDSMLSWFDWADNLYDSATYYPRQIIKIGRKQKNQDVQALGEAMLGYYFTIHDNHPQALKHYLTAMQLGEQKNNARVMLRLYNLVSFHGEVKNSIKYQQKVIALAKQTGELNWETLAYLQIGKLYLQKLKQYDSALYYLQKGYEMNLRLKATGKPTFSYDIKIPTELGNTFMKLKNPDLAIAYYRLGIQAAKKLKRDKLKGDFTRPYIGMAEYFKETGNTDSAFYYASKLFQHSEQKSTQFKTRIKVKASGILYQIYKEKGTADSALKYHEIYMTANDSLNSTSQAEKLKNLLSQEKERQNELAEKKLAEENARKHNLQYAAIALSLFILITSFLALSHTVIANQKLIKFLGVVSLLILFEFLNLLLHPYVGEYTHHSPVFMLLIMVCLAALLVPLHHKLEHWITHKMVEKNKRIRLAAARKTIAQLEETLP